VTADKHTKMTPALWLAVKLSFILCLSPCVSADLT
jgi:hypothetical protein